MASRQQRKAADKNNAEIDAEVKALRDDLTAWKESSTTRLHEVLLAELPEQIRADVKTALAAAEDARNEVQKYLVEKFQTQLRPEGDELDAALKEQLADYMPKVDDIDAQIAAAEKRRRHFDEIRALYDQPGDVVTPCCSAATRSHRVRRSSRA